MKLLKVSEKYNQHLYRHFVNQSNYVKPHASGRSPRAKKDVSITIQNPRLLHKRKRQPILTYRK